MLNSILEMNMTTAGVSAYINRLPLSRVLILLLAGGFAGLMMDIRVEHVDAVRERSIAWLPIIYSGVMAIACGAGFVFWSKTARLILMPLFLLAFIIGGMGFYFHNEGNLKEVLKNSVNAWTDPTMDHPDGPPQVAPLSFAGLGMIGILASLKRFNSEQAV
jgi:hypothetical protein